MPSSTTRLRSEDKRLPSSSDLCLMYIYWYGRLRDVDVAFDDTKELSGSDTHKKFLIRYTIIVLQCS